MPSADDCDVSKSDADDGEETLSFSTSSGCDFIFEREELLILGAHGSELVLTYSELREVALVLRSPRYRDLLSRLLGDL